MSMDNGEMERGNGGYQEGGSNGNKDWTTVTEQQETLEERNM